MIDRFDIYFFLCHPIRMLLVSVNQSSWFSLFAIFSTRNRGDSVCRYWIVYLPDFIFKENDVLTEEDNPSEKIVIVEEELDGIEIEI